MTWKVTNPWVMYAMYAIYEQLANTKNVEHYNIFHASTYCNRFLVEIYLDHLKDEFPEIYGKFDKEKIENALGSGDLGHITPTNREYSFEEVNERTLACIKIFSEDPDLRKEVWEMFKFDVLGHCHYDDRARESVAGFNQEMREAYPDFFELIKNGVNLETRLI